MSKILEKKITRRTFLKSSVATAAGVAAVAAVGDKLFGGPVSSLIESAEAATPEITEDKWIPTACRACRLHEPVQVHVVNGVAVKIDGIPGEPCTQGRICGLAQAGLKMLYNPWRIKTPMKRTNPVKGIGVDPEWVEISWDEALDTVANELRPVLETDSRQFAVAHGFGTLNETIIKKTFGPLGECKAGAPVCGGGFHVADTRTVMDGTHSTDFEYCNYLIVFGANWQNSAKAPIQIERPFMQAKARGMKVVVFDPVQADGARMADEWIPIRPATDHAVALAMANTLVNELGMVDWEHIRLRTNGPYLIAPDGDYARSKTETYVDEYRENLTFGKPYIWDSVDNKAKVFDDPTIKDFALEGTYFVDGVQCQPAWQLFKEFLKQYTPEWAEPISTVPAATIRRIAKEYGEASQIGATMTFYDDPDGPYTLPYRPVSVSVSKGAQGHYNAVMICRAIGLLRIITGAADVVGSVKQYDLGFGRMLRFPAGDGVIAPANRWIQWDFKYPPDVVTDTLIWSNTRGSATYFGGPHVLHSLLHPEEYHLPYRIKVRMVNYTNELRSRGNAELVVESLNTIPFTFAVSYHFDEPTELADIVFPESSYLDRWEVVNPSTAPCEFEAAKDAAAAPLTVLRQPVVERLYGRDSMDITRDIAERLGRLARWNEAVNTTFNLPDHLKLEPNTKYDWKDVLDRQLKASWGDEYGLEWFKVHGWKGVPLRSRKRWYSFNMAPQTRLPLYDEFWYFLRRRYQAYREEHGLSPMPELYSKLIPLPEWQGIWPLDEAPSDCDLYAVNFQNTAGFMCMAMDNPWLMEYSLAFDPRHMGVWLNTETAHKKGIKTGDRIKITSQFGHTVYGEALVTEAIHPECVGIAGCYGSFSVNVNPIAREGTHFNTLTSSELRHHDPVGGNIEFSPKVKVEKV